MHPTPASRQPHHASLTTLAAIAAILAVLFLCLSCGPAGFGLPDWKTVSGAALMELRLSRLVTGFFVGAGLAASGTALQAVLRNPLAEPYVLGVSSGGALGAALVIVLGLAAFHSFVLPLGAFVAASLTLVWVWLLAHRVGGEYRPTVLILTGVVVGSIVSSLLLLLLTFAPTRVVHGVTWWLLGNLQSTSWRLLGTAGFLIALSILSLFLEARTLNVLVLGKDRAYHAGVRLRVEVPLILGAATLASAAAVALSGVIGFVGLIVPHAVRRLFGANHRTLIPWAACVGGVFLVVCDTLSRCVVPPYEIPVGVITSLCGGPFFLYLLCSKQHGGKASSS